MKYNNQWINGLNLFSKPTHIPSKQCIHATTLPCHSTGWCDSGWTSKFDCSWAVVLVTLLLEYFDECTIRVTVLLDYASKQNVWTLGPPLKYFYPPYKIYLNTIFTCVWRFNHIVYVKYRNLKSLRFLAKKSHLQIYQIFTFWKYSSIS